MKHMLLEPCLYGTYVGLVPCQVNGKLSYSMIHFDSINSAQNWARIHGIAIKDQHVRR